MTTIAVRFLGLLFLVITSASGYEYVKQAVVPPAFNLDFGVVKAGDILRLEVSSPRGIATGTAAGGLWQGGPTTFTATIPENDAGEHVGTFIGTFINPVGTTPGPGWSGTAKVTAVKAEFNNMDNPHHVGITARGHNRTQHKTCTVTPQSEASHVTVVAQDAKITVSNMTVSGNIISFDLVGVTKSDAEGDTAVKAMHSTAGELAKRPVTVIVPAAIGTPHPQFHGQVVGRNILMDANSSPVAFDILKPGTVERATVYTTDLNVLVWDQFGKPCGDLYAGADIQEQAFRPINQQLRSDSTYIDPVGILLINLHAVKSGSKKALDFLAAPALPLPAIVDVQDIQVQVDGFELNPSVVDRTVAATPPATLDITWP